MYNDMILHIYYEIIYEIFKYKIIGFKYVYKSKVPYIGVYPFLVINIINIINGAIFNYYLISY